MIFQSFPWIPMYTRKLEAVQFTLPQHYPLLRQCKLQCPNITPAGTLQFALSQHYPCRFKMKTGTRNTQKTTTIRTLQTYTIFETRDISRNEQVCGQNIQQKAFFFFVFARFAREIFWILGRFAPQNPLYFSPTVSEKNVPPRMGKI